MPKPKGLYVLARESLPLIYGPDEQRDIAELIEVCAPPQTRESVEQDPHVLEDAEIILSGWGGPILDHQLLRAAPKLRALFYGAGGTGGMIYPEAWARGIRVTTAAAANAIPVAEFTLAAIVFALKQAIPLARKVRHSRRFPVPEDRGRVAGAYASVVGLVSLGATGRAVAERVRRALPDVRVLAYDPYVSAEEMRALGAEPVRDLETLFRRSDVVSLHTPWLPETEGMIRGRHLAAMKPRATLINTARGAIIAQEEMIAVLWTRPDLTALLDVTHPEPPDADSPLYTLPNVFLTPHIAGSLDDECRRMGRFMVEELRRYCAGEPLRWEIRSHPTLQHTIHRLPTAK